MAARLIFFSSYLSFSPIFSYHCTIFYSPSSLQPCINILLIICSSCTFTSVVMVFVLSSAILWAQSGHTDFPPFLYRRCLISHMGIAFLLHVETLACLPIRLLSFGPKIAPAFILLVWSVDLCRIALLLPRSYAKYVLATSDLNVFTEWCWRRFSSWLRFSCVSHRYTANLWFIRLAFLTGL